MGEREGWEWTEEEMEIERERMKTTRKQLTEELIEEIKVLPIRCIDCALQKSDSRYWPANILLGHAINAALHQVEMPADEDEVFYIAWHSLMHDIDAGVVNVIEAVFPEGQQCEAVKFLARRWLWAFWTRHTGQSQPYKVPK